MTIDLLVQKTVVHNFLRIPQSTFPFKSYTRFESMFKIGTNSYQSLNLPRFRGLKISIFSAKDHVSE